MKTVTVRDLRNNFAKLEAWLGEGEQIVPADWSDVHRLGEELSAKYTETEGHRFADIFHVATAVHLGAEGFLTFDSGQKKLARAEGLRVST